MDSEMQRQAVRYCSDRVLKYTAVRRLFKDGESLAFDTSYRLAQLPLVSPGHPEAISEAPGKEYCDGRYPAPRFALVVPIPWEDLASASAFRSLDAQLRATSFASKISWDMCVRRASKLHATIASSRSSANVEVWATAAAKWLERFGPPAFRLHGPFVGDRNIGRLYFPVYPQEIEGQDSFALLQDAVGVTRSNLYTVGHYHLLDQLNAEETAQLAKLIEEWRSVVIAEFRMSHLVVHATHDDLVLSGYPIVSIAGPTGTDISPIFSIRAARLK